MSEYNVEDRQELRFVMMENEEYLRAQRREIALGKEEGLDVSLYSNPEFNWLQMEQIRMGLKDNLDASLYADPANNYETMRQIRLSLYAGIDLIPYLNQGFVDDDLQEIRFALTSRLPIDQWLQDTMCAPQIHEIRIGLSEDIDIRPYADIRYNWMQMQQIRLGLEKKLDVSFYTNHLYNHSQMREIRLGLEADIDVSAYCSLVYSSADMKEKRLAAIGQSNMSAAAGIGSVRNNDSNSIQKTQETEGGAWTHAVVGKKVAASAAASSCDKDFTIYIEENGNKAYAYIPWVPGNVVTKDDIYRDLERRGIVFGIDKAAIDDLIDQRRMNQRILIAEGIPAKRGKDGWFEWFVRLDLPRIPAPLEDGSVDYVNIEAFEMVDEGEKIAVYHKAEPGKKGKNIYGEAIYGEHGLEKPPLRGVGFRIAQDGVTYLSKMNGKFEYTAGRIMITNMLIVREDVTAVTGKLEVDGSVYVIGSIYSGGYIKATGDIIIEHNVETCRLIAGGNIMIKQGSCSKNDCFIDAVGEVSGSFFEAANINARGNVKANYIMNSNIDTMGKVIVSGSKGVLLGGKIRAVKGVDAYNLGNRLHLKTVLDIGRNELYDNEIDEYEKQRKKLLTDLGELEQVWSKIVQIEEAGKEVDEEIRRKVYAGMEVQGKRLAELDAEEAKLVNYTEQMKEPVFVRGTAYEGSIIVLNGIKFLLTTKVRRVQFKLQNKRVLMVSV